MKKKTIVLTGTFDTKGEEYFYIKGLLEELGMAVLTINAGIYPSVFPADIESREVALIGGSTIEELREKNDRGLAMRVMSDGLVRLIPALYQAGALDGILAMGGSGGTSLSTAPMRALPLGVPKIMVSTLAGGDVRAYVGTSDILMMPSIVDIAGLNSISREVFRAAAMAMAGMAGLSGELKPDEVTVRPMIAATMYGVTTPCVMAAKEYLEARGFEVVIFHASGAGGRTMERLIEDGVFDGVLDITTTEWCDEFFGGVMAAGPHRNEAAAKTGTPQVVSVGGLDMITYGPPENVPEEYDYKRFYMHNPQMKVLRSTKEDSVLLGTKLAEKLNLSASRDKTALILPLRGISAVDAAGKVFYGPEEDRALFDTLRAKADRERVEIVELDCHINDREFAEFAAGKLIEMMENIHGITQQMPTV